MKTYEQLEQSCVRMGYKFFHGSVNLIGERTSDIFTDSFTDRLHLAINKRVISIPRTTKAGLYYVKNPVTAYGLNIKTGAYENIPGTAILKEGQYPSVYNFVDSYYGWLRYPYFMQQAVVDVYRDKNLDNKIDRDAPIHRGLFGINLHRMSNTGQKVGIIHNWSAGCNGAEEPEFAKILPDVRADVKKFGSSFSYTLFKSSEMY